MTLEARELIVPDTSCLIALTAIARLDLLEGVDPIDEQVGIALRTHPLGVRRLSASPAPSPPSHSAPAR